MGSKQNKITRRQFGWTLGAAALAAAAGSLAYRKHANAKSWIVGSFHEDLNSFRNHQNYVEGRSIEQAARLSFYQPEGRRGLSLQLPFVAHSCLEISSGGLIALPRWSARAALIRGMNVERFFRAPADHRFFGHGTLFDRGRKLALTGNSDDQHSGYIFVYDADSLQLESMIPSNGIFPHEISLLEDAGVVAVANSHLTSPGDRFANLSVLDLRRASSLQSVSLPYATHLFAWNKNEFLVGAKGKDGMQLYRVDLTRGLYSGFEGLLGPDRSRVGEALSFARLHKRWTAVTSASANQLFAIHEGGDVIVAKTGLGSVSGLAQIGRDIFCSGFDPNGRLFQIQFDSSARRFGDFTTAAEPFSNGSHLSVVNLV